MKKKELLNNSPQCQTRIVAIKDTMSLLSGKWKVYILGTLMHGGKMRFMDLTREVEGIGTKMLSKELQDLEANLLIKRTVLNTKPMSVEYELTEYGQTLEKVITEIMIWGQQYRQTVFHSNKED
ncbi:MAG: winged helix-turn-helix transcriptional regulator [Flavobacteriaceae bacterium]|nr:winged helix-turn-helix transcriptional regulator [Flavobacteriaceae bacterium]